MKRFLLFLAVLVCAIPASATITRVQSVSAAKNSGAAGALSATFGSTVTSGDTILVAACADYATGVSITVGGTNSETYTQDYTAAGADTGTCWAYRFSNTGGSASYQVSVTDSGGNAGYLTWTAVEYSGLSNSSPFDQSAHQDQASVTAFSSTNTGATAQASELLFGFSHIYSPSDAITQGTSWSSITTEIETFFSELYTQDQIVSSTGAYASTGTAASSANIGSLIVTYKASAGGGGSTTPPTQMQNGVGMNLLNWTVNEPALLAFTGCASGDTACAFDVKICDEKMECLSYFPGGHSFQMYFENNGGQTPPVSTVVASAAVQVTAQ